MKSLTLCIPIMNNLRWVLPMMGCLKYNTSEDVEYLIVDNGSTDPIERYIRDYIKPKKLNFIRFEENIGLMETNKLAYEQCQTDLLMLLHTDCFIFEKNWDKRVRGYFDEIPKLGIAGFFGAQGCMVDGGRLQDVEFQGQMSGMSNMLEAEIHGMRMKEEWRSAAIFDSFAMVLNMEMMKAGGGFDMRYELHHYFDRDQSLESLRRGYKNIVVNVPNHHIGGLTGESAGYQSWLEKRTGSKFEDGKIHNANKELFMKKWEKVLPLYVNDDFSFREGSLPFYTPEQLEYKGSKIVGMK